MSDLKVFGDATIRGGFTVGSALSYNFNIDKLSGDATLTGSLNVEGKTNFSEGKFTKLSVGQNNMLDTDPYIFYVEGNTRLKGNLIVNGTTTVIDTNINTSEQLIITNDGSAPCMVINQLGNNNIAEFKKNGSNKLFIDTNGNLNILGTLYITGGDIVKDGASSNTQWTTTDNDIYYNLGNIGLGTTTPTCKLEVNGVLKVTNNTISTSKTTGSIIISGGVGISGAMFINNANINGNIASTNTTSGSLIVTGGVGISGNLYANAIYDNGTRVITSLTDTLQNVTTRGSTTSSAITLTNNTNSTNISNGALVIVGGIGCGGNLYSGGNIRSLNTILYGSGINNADWVLNGISTNSNYKSLIFGYDNSPGNAGEIGFTYNNDNNSNNRVNIGFYNNINLVNILNSGNVGIGTTIPSVKLEVSGDTKITGTTNSSNINTGALIISGGAGISGNLYASAIYDNGNRVITALTDTLQTITNRGAISSNALSITNTTNSTNVNSGALIISGGIGINNNIYSGGIIYSNTFDCIGTTLDIGTTNASILNLGTANGTTTINIGTGGGATTINIGGNGDIVNILGTVNNISTTDLKVTDKIITLNKDAVGSGTARTCGIQFRDNNNDNNGYIVTNVLGNGFLFKSPENANIIDLRLDSFSNGILKNDSGTITSSTLNISEITGLQTALDNKFSNPNVINITNTTQATNVNTGAITVGGGMGISGNIHVGGSIYKNGIAIDANMSQWTTLNTNIYYNGGYVGINTSTPQNHLDVNGTVRALDYNTISDYRIKQNVKDIANKTIDNLRPVEYYNILTKQIEYGFIAHEVSEIFPELVKGTKNADNFQSINYIGLIAILVKEMKELKAKLN